MQQPTVFVWEDIGYLVEGKPSADGVFFSVWHMRTTTGSQGPYFETANGDLVSDHHKSIPVLNGRTNPSGCLDLLFESVPMHFCDAEQAAGVGELIQRLYRLEKAR